MTVAQHHRWVCDQQAGAKLREFASRVAQSPSISRSGTIVVHHARRVKPTPGAQTNSAANTSTPPCSQDQAHVARLRDSGAANESLPQPALSTAEKPAVEKASPTRKKAHEKKQSGSNQRIARGKWISVEEASERYPFSQAAIRHLIYQAEAYESCPHLISKPNGFLDVIVRPPNIRRVFLDDEKFAKWISARAIP